MRLDIALSVCLPQLGRRACKRLCEQQRVLLNDKTARAHDKVKNGSRVVVLEPPSCVSLCTANNTPTARNDTEKTFYKASLKNALSEPMQDTFSKHTQDVLSSSLPSLLPDSSQNPFVVTQNQYFAAIFKPSGLHSTVIGGSAHPALEAHLSELLPQEVFPPQRLSQQRFHPRLLNRLDGQTSGLVLAARTPEAVLLWQRAEAKGVVEKRYLAVIEGILHGSCVVYAPLDTDQRKRSRVCIGIAPFVRHTFVTPLLTTCTYNNTEHEKNTGREDSGHKDTTSLQGYSLVGCMIRKGARHQIRAHLGALGLPLLGDTRYGGKPLAMSHAPSVFVDFQNRQIKTDSTMSSQNKETFFLHHCHVRCADFVAENLPAWLPEFFPHAEANVRRWLDTAYDS